MKTIFLFMSMMSMCDPSQAQCSCGGSTLTGLGGEAAQSFLVLGKNQWLAESSFDYRRYRQSSSATHVHTHDSTGTSTHVQLGYAMQFSAGLRYGVTDRFTISVQVPFIILDASPAGGSGLGDLTVMGSCSLFHSERFDLAVQAGSELPTGKQSAVAGESTLSIGSGSYDPLAGAAFLFHHDRWMLRASAQYKYNATGFDQIQAGNVFSQALSVVYRPGRSAEKCSRDSLNSSLFSWNALALLTGDQAQSSFQNSVMLGNTGAFTVFAGAGASIRFGKLGAFGIISLPAVQQLKGEQTKTAYRARFGISYLFN